MAKVKDILKLLNEQISSQELSTILGASNINDVEVTEDGFKEIKEQVEGLLTIESAQTNATVKKALAVQHKKTFLTEFETKLTALAEKMGVTQEFSEAKVLDDKINLMVKKLDEKPEPTEDKLTLQKYKKELTELNAQIVKLNEAKEQEINKIKGDYEFESVKNAFISDLSTKYKLAEVYQKPEIMESLYERAFSEAQKQALIKREGKEIKFFDKETPEKPFFIKNKPAGYDDIVVPILKDYLKVSEPAPKGPSNQKLPAMEADFKPGSIAAEMARRKQEAFSGMMG